MTLTPDMRAVIEVSQLCFAATVTPDGHPNLFSRGGYRFAGTATLHHPGGAVYDDAVRRVYGDTTPSSPPTAVVLLAVERAAPLLSPAYWRGLDEHEIRAQWRARRATLDREFEEYLSQVGPARIAGAHG